MAHSLPWSTRFGAFGVCLMLLSCALACSTVGAAEAPIEKPAEKKAAEQDAKPVTGRLPPYYAKVVDRQQRMEIYRIQAEYRTKIDAARAALQALIDERDAAVVAVLTPEQKQQVEQAAAAAKQKRRETRAHKAAEQAPPAVGKAENASAS